MVKRAFFLDRDGVLNPEVNYLHDPEQAALLPGAAEAIAALHRAGFLAVVTTNQSGVARGMYPATDILAVHARLQRLLLTSGGPDATVDAWYFCPHHPEISGPCSCRKPAPGMLLQAAADLGLTAAESFMVGDRMSDLEAGRAAGCAGCCLVRTGYGVNVADSARAAGFPVADDLPDAVRRLLG